MGADAFTAGFSGIGTLASGFGAFGKNKAAAKAAKYNKKVAQLQARVYRLIGDQQAKIYEQVGEDQAQLALGRGRENERRQRVEAEKLLGAGRAAYGASGVDLQGSPLDVLQQNARTAELDALSVRYNAQVEAYNSRLNASIEAFNSRIGAEANAIGASATAALNGLQASSLKSGGISDLILSGIGGAAQIGGGLYSSFIGSPSTSSALAPYETSLRRSE